jgi:RNA polymerase sigma-70 factor (ECF subfamily)
MSLRNAMQVMPVRSEIAVPTSEALEADDRDALAARTNLAAFGPIYERHREAVWRYLRGRCGSDDDALELTAVTFERALTGIGRYRPRGGGMRAWLLRIARNAAIDHGRRHGRVSPLGDHHDRADAGPTPEEMATGAETRDALLGLVATLPPDQRDAIALRFGGGLTAREIGTVLGKREGATQKLISRGLARLREAYDDQP